MIQDFLQFPFLQRALAAGLLIALTGGLIGVFITQRKMSFLGSGLAHAAFGGVAIGLYFGAEPLYIAVPFTIAVSLLINFLRDKTRLMPDTVIGIMFALSVAVGIVFLSQMENFSSDAYTYLFGSVLAVNPGDIYFAAGIALLSLIFFLKAWPALAYLTFDEELARSDKVNSGIYNYIFTALVAVIIVVSIKIVGIILIAAFLVIPAASARLVARSFFGMTVYSVVVSLAGTILGLVSSYIIDWPAGATIVLAQTAIFIVFALAGNIGKSG
jgi:zinc transport system permease protein